MMRSGAIGAVLVGVVAVACGGSTASSVTNPNGDAQGHGTSGSVGTGDRGSSGNSDSTKTSSDAGTDAKKVTSTVINHRAAPVACSHVRAAGSFDPNIQGGTDCSKDADCTSGQGSNGRCMVTTVAAHLNYCSYDLCFEDTDCAGHQACTCRETPNDANRCAAGNCTIDADCGPSGYCSPSVDFDKTNFGVTGYWCHTAGDACRNDTDCQTSAAPQAKCAYEKTSASWKCSSQSFLPP